MYFLDTTKIKTSLPGVKMTMVLEVSPNNPFVYCSPADFDAYIVLKFPRKNFTTGQKKFL
jgi:hypothetical protein